MTDSLPEAFASSIKPTEQQEAIIASILRGESCIITARAGCAKTSTLLMAARALHERDPTESCQYVVFNKRNQVEAQAQFPANWQCVTINGLGHRAWADAMRKRLTLDTKKATTLLDLYLQDNNLSATFEEKVALTAINRQARTQGLVLADSQGAGFVDDTTEGWLDVMINAEVDIDQGKLEETIHISRGLLRLCVDRARMGQIDFIDQIYMPVCYGGVWPRHKRRFGDEAQDFSPQNIKMLTLAIAEQKVFVGDPKQAIYMFRGALADSMNHLEKTKGVGTEWKHHTLSKTFRCGKAIVKRQLAFVPDFVAAEQNAEGMVLNWPHHIKHARDGMDEGTWQPKDIPDHSAILCRNNAPLISCALRLLRARRKVTVLGRDFAERLKKDVSKAVGKNASGSMPIDEVMEKVRAYYESKLDPSKKPTERQLEAVQEKVEAILALADGAAFLSDLSDNIAKVFSDDVAPITLATGHKAKGLEWPFVIHLNPFLIPSRRAVESGDPDALEQEYNLRYVIETRARETLVLANLDDMEV